ncbi:hypothetical protein NCCP2495_23740 [Dietzia sp. NCCP-2495]|uniref:DUF4192 domain-containing protein n=1 Tax=Dietzia sp. NCCP-2495 TaxID=2934675 RepID=UPI00222EB658|nr:DUF4192 domain-containing protein [Dietzia sp. NCCP-2495]GLB64495.1 hypothetical protein NCCP2495_23740 [Dietzia sp. NCCP-2495]
MTARHLDDNGTEDREQVVISSPEELIASVPAMLGYPPDPCSVVIVCSKMSGGGQGPVMRIDVPGLGDDGFPEHDLDEWIYGDHDGDELDDPDREPDFGVAPRKASGEGEALEIARYCRSQGVEAAFLIVVGEGCTSGLRSGLRAEDVAAEFREELERAGTTVVAAYGVEGFAEGRDWVDLFGMVRGVQIDPAGTQIAAVHAFEGRVRAESRSQIAELYAVRDEDACYVDPAGSRRGARAGRDRSRRESTWEEDESRVAADVERHDAVAARLGAGEEIDDDELAVIGQSLLVIAVRDEVYRGLARRRPQDADGRRELWWRLARRRPPRERSVALLLLGATAYFAGSGVHAMFAFEAALEADAHNSLAGLLLESVLRGLNPDQLRHTAAA